MDGFPKKINLNLLLPRPPNHLWDEAKGYNQAIDECQEALKKAVPSVDELYAYMCKIEEHEPINDSICINCMHYAKEIHKLITERLRIGEKSDVI